MRRRGEDATDAPVCEPVPVEDVFVSGISGIEDHGDWLRFELYTSRDGQYGPMRVIVARLTMTRESFIDMLAVSTEKAAALPRRAEGRRAGMN